VPLWARRGAWDDDREPATRLQDGGLKGLGLIFGHPVLRALAVTGLCFAGFQVCLMAFAMTLLTELGWSLVGAGLVVTAMQAAGVAGRIGWSMLADRFGHGLIVLGGVGILITALGFGTSGMTTQTSAAVAVAALSLFGGCLIGWNGIYMGEAARVSGPANVGVATGGILMFNFIGVIVMPATFGLVAKANGSIAATFGLFALLPLFGTLALLPAIGSERRRAKIG
jgi:MFS family permease